MKQVSAEHLLTHGPFLRGLAQALLRDPARADDVVQEAYLAALRGAPADAAALRPWLTRVVRNLARKVRRTEARRARREERAAAPDFVRSTTDIVETESVRRRVVAAVLSLPEPSRTVILMRYYDDLAPREIARRTGVSGSTVRTRLQRGLHQLRGVLDRTHGARRTWCLALLTWAVPTRAPAAPALMTGAIAMKLKIGLLAAALLIALLGATLWTSDRGATVHGRGTTRSAARGAAHPAVAVTPPTPAAGGDARRTAPAGATSAAEIGMRVLVRLEGGGDAPVAVTLRAGAVKIETSVTPGRRHTVDAQALFEETTPTDIEVVADAGGYVAATRRIPVRQANDLPSLPEFEATLRRARVVVGIARDPAGRGGGLRVAGFPLVRGVPRELAAATTTVNADGRYELELEHEGDYLIVLFGASLRPAMRTVRVRGMRSEAPTADLGTGERIRGRVTGADGKGLAGAVVRARRIAPGQRLRIADRSVELLWRPDRIEPGLTSVPADAEGRYEFAGLPSGAHEVEIASVPGARFGTFQDDDGARYRRPASAPAEGVDFVVPLCKLEILVSAAGRGVAGATVVFIELRGGSSYSSDDRTDAEGRLTALAAAGAEYVLEVRSNGFEQARRKVTAPGAGQAGEVVVTLAPAVPKATLAVRLHAPDAGPLPIRCLFKLVSLDGGKTDYVHAKAEKGGYVLRGVPPGAYRLELRPSDPRRGGFLLGANERVELVGGVRTDVTLRPGVGGRVVFHVRDPEGQTTIGGKLALATAAGRELAASVAQIRGSTSRSVGNRLPGLGGPVYLSDPLPPGRYRLQVVPDSDALAAKTVEFDVRRAETTEVQIPLEQR